MIKNKIAQFAPFIKYCIVGTSGTFIDLATLYVFVEYLFFPVIPAATLSFILAVINNFTWNKIWTFQNKSKNYRKLFIKFLIVSVIGLLLTIFLMHIFVNLAEIWYMFAKVLTSGVVLTWNFLANKFWTFKPHKRKNFENFSPSHDLSIIIPAYNEEKRIPKTLEEISYYLRENALNAEIIVIDDGSKDSTAQIVKNLAKDLPFLKLVSYKNNRGKGYAVKRGIMEAEGKHILFTDADNSTPIEEIFSLQQEMQNGKAQIAIGSRYLKKDSVKIRQPFYRILIGRLGNMLIRLFLIDGIKDTQCGFKLFENKVAKEIFSLQKIERWGFDMEALAIANNLGYRIVEVPVNWYDAQDSRIRPIKDALSTFKELLLIKINLICGRYYPGD